jgi:hypothetical protein
LRLRVLLTSSILVGLLSAVVAWPGASSHTQVANQLRSPEGRGSRPSPSAGRGALIGAAATIRPDAARRAGASSGKRPAFGSPVYVTSNADTQGAEPSIRVDSTDPNHRIWITAPTGIGVDAQPLLSAGGDLFWSSDDNGKKWTRASGTGGVSSPTIVGGGDTDVTTRADDAVFGTGLTLANVTLAASCDNGQTWTTNPISTAGTIEDRQWLDAYEDRAKPAGAPDFGLDIGLAQLVTVQQNQRVVYYQVFSQACAPPVAGPPIDTALPSCPLTPPNTPDCYQWPGNVAFDEATGDAYVTYNTQGDLSTGLDDKIVVARIDGGGSAPATQSNAHVVVAAANRPDTFDSFTVVAVDKASNVYVLWNERRPGTDPRLGQTVVMYAYSTNRGATWSAPIQVNQGPKTTTFPWIVAGGAGKIDIVYYGTDATGPSPETVPSTSQWRVYMAQSLNATAKKPTFAEVAATGVLHRGSICTSGTGCAAGTRDLLDYFQVDVDEQGLANIAYTDNFNTPPDGSDPHQEWVTFVQQNGGATLLP